VGDGGEIRWSRQVRYAPLLPSCVTTEFLREARMQRDALDIPDLVPVVIDHPLSILTDAEIDQSAEQAAAQCVSLWRER
jgi:hypothetical protein